MLAYMLKYLTCIYSALPCIHLLGSILVGHSKEKSMEIKMQSEIDR